MSQVEELRRRALGPFAEIKEMPVHEGKTTTLMHPDGSSSTVNPELLSCEFDIQLSTWGTPSGQSIESVLNRIATEVAEQQQRGFFKGLKEATERVGNVRDYHGAKFSLDQILEMMQMTEMSFDSRGRNDSQMIILSPELHDRMQEILSDPNTRAEFERKKRGLYEKKYDEWRDREANRKLVD